MSGIAVVAKAVTRRRSLPAVYRRRFAPPRVIGARPGLELDVFEEASGDALVADG